MFHHFRLLPFIAGIVIGYIVSLIYKPEKQIIRQYPHPDEASKKVFKDPNGACYTYTSHEVNCDANEATLKDYPVQGS
jgi:hypothetical protein